MQGLCASDRDLIAPSVVVVLDMAGEVHGESRQDEDGGTVHRDGVYGRDHLVRPKSLGRTDLLSDHDRGRGRGHGHDHGNRHGHGRSSDDGCDHGPSHGPDTSHAEQIESHGRTARRHGRGRIVQTW